MVETKLDDLAWRILYAIKPVPLSESYGNRPRNYAELEQRWTTGVAFEDAWSDFRQACFAHRDASFFAHPSSPSLSVKWQAVLAGAAEWLSAQFNLPHPMWTDESRYFLVQPWDVFEEVTGISEFRDKHLAESSRAFRKRKR